MTDDTSRAPLTAQEIDDAREWLTGYAMRQSRYRLLGEPELPVEVYARNLDRALDELEALRAQYLEMCDRLQECVQRHGLGLGGERVDVLVVEEVDRLVAENAKLREVGIVMALEKPYPYGAKAATDMLLGDGGDDAA